MMVPLVTETGAGEAQVCRGCLCTGRRMMVAQPYSELYAELTQVLMRAEADARLCWECAAQLTRAVRVRRKFLRSHALLAEYACSQLCPWDKESPGLAASATLSVSFDCQRSGSGFHSILTHEKCYPTTFTSLLDTHKEEVDVKEEFGGGSDYDDHITLDEIKQLTVCADEDTECKVKLEHEPALAASAARKRKKKDKHERRKRVKKEAPQTTEERAARVRRAVEVDPDKIRLIQLDPVEQVRARAAAANSSGFLRFPFKCELCYRGFNYEAKLHNHMKKHDPARGKFECKLCSMFLPSIYSYNVHMLTHTTRYECVRCGKQMIDRGCIVEHYETAHEGKVQQFTCRLCGKISSNSKTHRGHMRNHHSGERPRCDQCGKTFVNKDSLSEHILIHQGIKNHECEACGDRFRTKTQLKHHQLKHTTARDYYCVECDVRFKSAHNLRQHLSKSARHRDADAFRYECPRCPRRLDSARALEHHIAFGHDGRRLHPCSECGAQLATRNSLAKHTRVAHQGYRAPLKHVCDTCGRAFRGKNVLVNHMRTHTGEKPYDCGECGRKFSQRTAMRTHVKLVHLKLKRGAKVREVAAAKLAPPAPPPPPPKDEVLVVYEPWCRGGPHQSDVFYVGDA